VDTSALDDLSVESTVERTERRRRPRHTRRDLSDRVGMAPHTADHRSTASVEDVVARFLDGRLAADEWTHAAHLLVCRHVLDASETTDVAIARLRHLIRAHNDRVGLRPGQGGYHETITRYFVGAMADADPPTIASLLTEPTLRRDAPLDHWSPELLATHEARTAWVDPDLAPVPWPTR
jgi:hypothetical protein